jgi:predicted nucleic acid-binding protein
VIHFDTSFLIGALVRTSGQDRQLRRWLRAGKTLGMCSIAWAEFLCGPLDQTQIELATRFVSERPPFAEEDAALAAELFNASGRRRGSLADCMIAASAIRAGASLATINIDDFRRFTTHGLELRHSP